jgi:hypothetical protein
MNNGAPIMDDAMQRTNADRIRSMTDEELAEWIAARIECEVCPVSHDEPISGLNECHKRIIGWLKEEAKDDRD